MPTSPPPPPQPIRLLDGAFYAGDPHPAYAWLREHAPLHRDEETGIWAVSRHADVMTVSGDAETFASGGGSRPEAMPFPSMINLDNPAHNLRRALINKGFTPRRIAAYEPKVRRIASELIDAVADRGACDFVEAIAAQLPMIMIGDLLGVEPADRGRLLEWSDDMVAGTNPTMSDDVAARSLAALLAYTEYQRAVIEDRRKHPRDDLVSVFVAAEVDGERLDDESLLHESLNLLIGGNETTRNVISGALAALDAHPEQYATLRAHPERLPQAVEEFVRWVTPISNMCRTATRDVELHGRTIAAGERVVMLYGAANRDAAVFDAPDVFDVARSPNPHVAFGGHGAHYCLGASLARLEIRVTFEELFRRLPDLRVVPGTTLEHLPSVFVRGIRRLPVTFTPTR